MPRIGPHTFTIYESGDVEVISGSNFVNLDAADLDEIIAVLLKAKEKAAGKRSPLDVVLDCLKAGDFDEVMKRLQEAKEKAAAGKRSPLEVALDCLEECFYSSVFEEMSQLKTDCEKKPDFEKTIVDLLRAHGRLREDDGGDDEDDK